MFGFSAMFFMLLIASPYLFLSVLFDTFRNEYQPFLGLILPVIRELNGWIMSKLIANAANGDVSGAKLIGNYLVSTWHAIFLCWIVGGYTTDTTSWLVLIADFIINVGISLQLVYVKKKRPDDIERQYTLLLELALYELIEFIVPLAFLLTFLASYYGPNSTLIGNVGTDYWHYTAVKDIRHYVKNIMMFFILDVASAVVSGIVLWVFCKVNLFKTFAILEKEFAAVFCVILSALVQGVSRMTPIPIS